MKTLLKLLGSLLIGVAIGLLIAIAGLWILKGITPSIFFHKLYGSNITELILVAFGCMIWAMISFSLLIFIHEAGHLVCGILTGYKFVSFRVFNYVFINEDGKIRVKRYGIEGTGGQCLLAPPSLPLEKIPTGWYNFGGILANFLTLFVAIPFLFTGNALIFSFAVIFLLMDVFILLINGIPMNKGGVGNDAYNMLLLRHNLTARRGLVCQLRSNALIQKGVRPKDMPDELFYVPEHIDYGNALEVSLPIMRASRCLDEVLYDKALEGFEELYAHKERIMKIYVKEIACELAYLYLLFGRADEASSLLDDNLMKYITAYSRMMSSKLRLLCAISLFKEGDPEKAVGIYNDLLARRGDYLLQGEVKSDLALMHSMLADAGLLPDDIA